ncbi:nitroreductase [Mumia zhuanghuii]|uniref:Nitroreductase n=2 Tax=Mumia TaxID=1546255 RepID=A0ABW1QJR5_9ACTN|nr:MULTISPECIES: nitroreductase [Mumia]KAA1418320.1 nitroreductase [Mumia zhuanghuii]
MQLSDVLAQRWSCRAFRSEPVPAETLRDVLTLAQRTASWCNTQPWHVHLLSGDATRELAASLTAHVQENAPSSDLPTPQEYSGVYRQRRRDSGFALYESLGIERDDLAARGAQMLRNFTFFGAPHAAIITTDRAQGVYGAVDCGGYVANLLNAAHAYGVATVAQAAIAMYSDHVREVLGIADDRLVVCAVALGHADEEHPVNGFRTTRAPLEESVTFVT